MRRVVPLTKGAVSLKLPLLMPRRRACYATIYCWPVSPALSTSSGTIGNRCRSGLRNLWSERPLSEEERRRSSRIEGSETFLRYSFGSDSGCSGPGSDSERHWNSAASFDDNKDSYDHWHFSTGKRVLPIKPGPRNARPRSSLVLPPLTRDRTLNATRDSTWAMTLRQPGGQVIVFIGEKDWIMSRGAIQVTLFTSGRKRRSFFDNWGLPLKF